MSDTKTASAAPTKQVRWLVIGLIVLVAFFASYRFAVAQGAASPAAPSGAAYASSPAPGVTGAGAGTPAGSCGCCGGGAAGPQVSKQAQTSARVQRISVDLSSGSYNPSEIVLKAGVPAEITFGQATGCLGQVKSSDLGFSEDLTGGPKTVKLPGLKAGTYSFSCGMSMVFGSIVVK